MALPWSSSVPSQAVHTVTKLRCEYGQITSATASQTVHSNAALVVTLSSSATREATSTLGGWRLGRLARMVPSLPPIEKEFGAMHSDYAVI